MVDGLNVFSEIKTVLKSVFPEADVYAFGSRVRGSSKTNKWDFDVLLTVDDLNEIKEARRHLDKYFDGRVDEFGKPIVIDLFRGKTKGVQKNKDLKNVVLL